MKIYHVRCDVSVKPSCGNLGCFGWAENVAYASSKVETRVPWIWLTWKCVVTRPLTSLVYQGGVKSFLSTNFLTMPNNFNHVLHMFPEGEKKFAGGIRPPGYGPGRNTNFGAFVFRKVCPLQAQRYQSCLRRGRRRDFFRGGHWWIFLEGPKVANFVFSHSKLRKHFLLKFSKSSGGQGPPLRRPYSELLRLKQRLCHLQSHWLVERSVEHRI